ncbi:MAG: amidase [Candidatus Poriferisodalaceae bacterium]
MTDPSELGAVEARRLIGTGELSPVELVDACIAQRERIDPVVNAMVARCDERARAEAERAAESVARGDSLGALHGLPVAIKDLQPTEGVTTTFGSELFEHNVPTADAGIVARVRSAGGIVIGKTNIPEMSIGANTVNRLFGATGNPFDVEATCGGSSGGSAVALACNMAPLATGSDHGGSLRIPACYSGVVGHRATPGMVPHEARTTPQTFYSVQGPMGRSVPDTALLMSAIAGRDHGGHLDPMAFPLDASRFAHLDQVDPSNLRVAVTADLGGLLVSASIRATFEARVAAMANLVGAVTWHDIDLTAAPDVDWRLRQDVFVSQYHRDADSFDEGFNPNVKLTYESALDTPMFDIAVARRSQMDLLQSFAAIFEDHDVVICPGVSIPPFPWAQLNPQEIDGEPVTNYMAWLGLTSSITVVGHPVTALPAGIDENGTPFGVQVIGPMYSDHRLLSIAAALESAWTEIPELRRPIPDFETLAKTPSRCRTDGRNVY